MASTGDVLGGTAASTTGSTNGDTHWTNPSNALVDSSTAATCSGAVFIVSYWLHITNFGFSIPAGSTINGITVKVRRKCSSSNDWITQDCRLVNSGTQLGTLKNASGAGYWPSTAAVETFGSASDLWGWTPVIATINSSSFGIQINGEDLNTGSDTASIEVVWMNIDYTAPGGGGVSSSKSMLMWF